MSGRRHSGRNWPEKPNGARNKQFWPTSPTTTASQRRDGRIESSRTRNKGRTAPERWRLIEPPGGSFKPHPIEFGTTRTEPKSYKKAFFRVVGIRPERTLCALDDHSDRGQSMRNLI